MSLDIIRDRLVNYNCHDALEEEHALKEITQEIVLLGLARQNFFTQAEFHGGTALRILYGLPRFSEDLDFALLTPDKSFSLAPFLKNLTDELSAFGYQFEITDRSDTNNAVKKAFIKDDSLGKLLILKAYNIKKKIKIKIEIDTNPPLGATTEMKTVSFPQPFVVQAKDLPSSFAGKLHAILCRSYLKGRDWFDFIWYVNRKTSINYPFLKNALEQNGPWENQDLTIDANWLREQLNHKIIAINWEKARADVATFLRPVDQVQLKLWDKDFFLATVTKLLP